MIRPADSTYVARPQAAADEHHARQSTAAQHLALVCLYALVIAGYFVLRYATRWTEGDTTLVTRAIESVQSRGTVLPYGGVVYPHGFSYQAVAVALLFATGLSVDTLQTVVWPLLATTGLALAAYVFYARLSGDRRAAILAVLFLLLQADMLFVTLRGSHEKLTWVLIVMALTLLHHSIGGPLSLMVIDVFLFYLVIFALTSVNVFFASTFVAAVVLGLVFGMAGFILSRRRSSLAAGSLLPSDLRRLIYVSLSCGILFFLFVVYVYPPALLYVVQLGQVGDQIGAAILSFDASGQPYEYISYGWISRGAYLGLTLFTWMLIALSFAEWVRQGIDILRGRQALTLSVSFEWLLYAGFALQVGLSIAVDYAGVLSQNLQLRIFPGFAIMAALLLSRGVWRLFSSPRLSPGRRPRRLVLGLLALACAWFAVASVLKATNEPLLSNKWMFYSLSEDGAIGWTEEQVRSASVWSGVDERLREVFNLRHRATTQSENTYAAFTLDIEDRYILLSERERLHGMRMGVALPLVDDWLQVYDNGDASLYHRRPRTPYQR